MSRASIKKFYHTPIRLTVVAATLIADIVLMYAVISTRTPKSVGPLGITLVITMMFVAVLATFTVVKMIMKRTTKVSIQGIVGLALIPTIIIALNSLRQLSVVDIVLIIIFAAFVNLYLRKALSVSEDN